MTDPNYKFVADVMLGRLSRWLRLLGYDVKYSPDNDDNKLLYLALTEERLLLTRDRKLAERASKQSILIGSEKLVEQLKELVNKAGISTELRFSRCSICNKIIKPIDKKAVIDKVPPYTYKTHDEFYYCPECERIYWKGSHKKLIRDFLEKG
ncbi:Mut7-C RNAse domain-containing protein [bacterium]|nr:Mut7-C RNAse domain-containing protein [bacterium]